MERPNKFKDFMQLKIMFHPDHQAYFKIYKHHLKAFLNKPEPQRVSKL